MIRSEYLQFVAMLLPTLLLLAFLLVAVAAPKVPAGGALFDTEIVAGAHSEAGPVGTVVIY